MKMKHRPSPQHQFSKWGWSQHSDSASKVCDVWRRITIPKMSPWPTDYTLPVPFLSLFPVSLGHTVPSYVQFCRVLLSVLGRWRLLSHEPLPPTLPPSSSSLPPLPPSPSSLPPSVTQYLHMFSSAVCSFEYSVDGHFYHMNPTVLNKKETMYQIHTVTCQRRE